MVLTPQFYSAEQPCLMMLKKDKKNQQKCKHDLQIISWISSSWKAADPFQETIAFLHWCEHCKCFESHIFRQQANLQKVASIVFQNSHMALVATWIPGVSKLRTFWTIRGLKGRLWVNLSKTTFCFLFILYNKAHHSHGETVALHFSWVNQGHKF